MGLSVCLSTCPAVACRLSGGRTDILADTGILLAGLTAMWTAFAVVDSGASQAGRRQQWFSILAGPPGAALRWWLSQWNYRLPGRLAWFPAGTFAANMLAVLVRCAVQVRAHL
jgi:fluoride exporter